jgi:hypothetical protein
MPGYVMVPLIAQAMAKIVPMNVTVISRNAIWIVAENFVVTACRWGNAYLYRSYVMGMMIVVMPVMNKIVIVHAVIKHLLAKNHVNVFL